MQNLFRSFLIAALAALTASSARAATPALTDVDVGWPSLPGSMTTATDASGGKVYTIIGGGDDIWNTADNFHYAYFKVTGDFDYMVKVQDLQGPDAWTKAELMARESMDDGTGTLTPQGGDRHISNMTTRSAGQNQVGLQWRHTRDGGSQGPSDVGMSAPLTRPAYPNTWLRLRREGDVFITFFSTNGVDWAVQSTLDSADLAEGAFANTILLGLAVTAHNDADTTGGKAVFSDFKAHTPIPVAITAQPAPISIAANKPITLSIQATGDPIKYQWSKDGVALPDGTNATYVIALGKASDSGNYTVKLTGHANEVTSGNLVLTVTVDNTDPILVSAKANATFDKVTLTFSEPVDEASAQALASYSISPALSITAATVANLTNVVLTTGKQTPETVYTVTVNGVKDLSGNTVAAGTQKTFKAFTLVTGNALVEFYAGMSFGANQASLDRLRDTADTLVPTSYLVNTSAETTTWENGADQGARMQGYLIAPETGDYTFYISSDDFSSLYLSTDDSPANLSADPIATVTSWTNQREWTKEPNQASAPVTLTKGKRYFFRALEVEGGGGDGVSVGWVLPSAAADGTITVPTGSQIAVALNGENTTITIVEQPKSVTSPINRTVTFSVVATATSDYGSSVTYQWQKGGVDIAGATSATYTTPLITMADNNTSYTVKISAPAKTVTSTAAILTVTSDSTPPTVVSAGSLGSKVGVAFDELVEQASAETISNYTVTGATVSGASLKNGKYVELVLSGPVSAAFTVTVRNVKDEAGNAMTSSATVTGQVSDMQAQDIGSPGADPLLPGNAFYFGNNGYYVAGHGSDIWNNADAAHYLYKQFTGPLDLRTRVESLDGVDAWAKAGLMVRETLDAGSRHIDIVTTRTAGQNIYNVQWRETTDGASASKDAAQRIGPVAYPNAWIRLVRENDTNNEFKAYLSTNGINWNLYHTYALAGDVLPKTLYVGMAVTSHSNVDTTPLSQGIFPFFSVAKYQAVVDPQLKIAREGAQVSVTWAAGTLLSSPAINGTYAPVQGAASPYKVTPANGATTFYKVQQ